MRFIFLKNNENLPEDAKIILHNMRGEFQELGDAYMLCSKRLCGLFIQEPKYHARIAFHRWIKLAEETRIPELRTLAKTIKEAMICADSF